MSILFLWASSVNASGLDTLLKKQLIHQITSEVKQEYSNLEISNLRINFKVNNTIKNFPSDAVMVLLNRSPHSKIAGSSVLDVDITNVNGEIINQRKIPVYVNAKVLVWRAKESFNTDKIITEKDIIQDYIELDKVSGNTLSHKSDIIGKEVVTNIIKNSIITKREVRKAALIKRGKDVTIIIKKPSLVFKIKGTALDNGYLEEKIRVKSHFKNKKVMRGKVIDSETVIIDNLY